MLWLIAIASWKVNRITSCAVTDSAVSMTESRRTGARLTIFTAFVLENGRLKVLAERDERAARLVVHGCPVGAGRALGCGAGAGDGSKGDESEEG